jgi:hypothetical protein
MASEYEQLYVERVRQDAEKAEAALAEVAAIELRIARLRERLAAGDPDLEADELQAAIERAEAKRRELLAAQPAAKQSAKLFAMMPRAAEEYGE